MNHSCNPPELCDAIKEVIEKLYGNGNPGLISDMRAIKESIDALKDSDKDKESRLRRVEYSIWAGFGGLAILQLIFKMWPK